MSTFLRLLALWRQQRNTLAANDPAQVSQGTGNTTVAPGTNPPMKDTNPPQVSPLSSVNIQRWRVGNSPQSMAQRAQSQYQRDQIRIRYANPR